MIIKLSEFLDGFNELKTLKDEYNFSLKFLSLLLLFFWLNYKFICKTFGKKQKISRWNFVLQMSKNWYNLHVRIDERIVANNLENKEFSWFSRLVSLHHVLRKKKKRRGTFLTNYDDKIVKKSIRKKSNGLKKLE